jgi:uncharacterized ubiquitin-like protein YukD
MAKLTTMKIGLHWRGQSVDLQVPTEISLDRLAELVAEVAPQLGWQLPTTWELDLTSKTFDPLSNRELADYPVSNGDQWAIRG